MTNCAKLYPCYIYSHIYIIVSQFIARDGEDAIVAEPGKDVLKLVWLDIVEASLGTERVLQVDSKANTKPKLRILHGLKAS